MSRFSRCCTAPHGVKGERSGSLVEARCRFDRHLEWSSPSVAGRLFENREEGCRASPGPHSDVASLMDGYLRTQLLYVAARLRLADVLADGPQSASDLAAAVKAEPSALHRILRGLAILGIVEEAAQEESVSPRRAGFCRLMRLVRCAVPSSAGATSATARLQAC